MTDIYNRPDGKNRFQIASAASEELFSAWLDQEFNRIYGVLNGLAISDTVSASEWTTIAGTYTQVSATSFSVPGDMTGVFEALRAIQFTDDNEVTSDSHIQSASYNSGTGLTTVVVYDAVVPATISKVGVGIISTASATIPSTNTVTKTADYAVGAKDEIILADDSNSYTGSMVYDDGQVGGNSYPALLITLPQPSVLPNKLLCVKKIAGSYRTIVSAHFTHSTSLNADNETVHTNTYDFQILGDTTAKNRVELKGIGDCYWFVSNGTNWYELTPEASETVKGIVRFATTDEMTLTAQQIADGETLPNDLAVSPYHADIEYMRTDASNMRFASNYIYKAGDDQSVATLQNGTIVLAKGLGVNIPTGRDTSGVCTSKKYELTSNLVLSTFPGVSAKLQLLFLKSDGTLIGIWAKDFYTGYNTPTITDTQVGDNIIWFDYGANLLKLSTDNGTNWTTFDGAGPICEYYGNGSSITHITSYKPVAFLTRDVLQNIYQQSLKNMNPDYNNAVSGTLTSGQSVQVSKDSFVYLEGGFAFTNNLTMYVKPDSSAAGIKVGYFYNDRGSNTWLYSAYIFVPKGWYFYYQVSGNEATGEYSIFPLQGANE